MPRAAFSRELREGWDEFRSRTWLWVIVVAVRLPERRHSRRGRTCSARSSPSAELGGAAAWASSWRARRSGFVARRRPACCAGARSGMLLVAALATSCSRCRCSSLLAIPAPVRRDRGRRRSSPASAWRSSACFWDTAHAAADPARTRSRACYSYDALGSFVFIPVGAPSRARRRRLRRRARRSSARRGVIVAVRTAAPSCRRATCARCAAARAGRVTPSP